MTDEVQETVTTTTAYKCVKCGKVWKTEKMAKDCAQRHIWPKKVKVYLHGGKESDMWGKGLEIGLSEEVCENEFRGALYEVTFDIEVSEDGTYKILRVYQNDNGPFYIDSTRVLELIDHALTGINANVYYSIESAVEEIARLQRALLDIKKMAREMAEGK